MPGAASVYRELRPIEPLQELLVAMRTRPASRASATSLPASRRLGC
jgi:hypothetical protein